MTLELEIPDLQAAAPEHTQWRVEALQMVNWGGFHGRTEVRFSPGSTLLSGASGTGKSTVLDAYIALMMPSNTPFNGASNDAGGRARSAEQRNLLTYLRGKMDANRVDGSDEMLDLVLRGAGMTPIWGALAATFVNDRGRRYTAMRIYFVKAGASANGDVTTTFAAYEGYFDTSKLAPLATSRFDKRALKAAVPGLTTFNTFWEFEGNLHTRLGIGGADGGRKAMRLLARLQAGMEVKRVDGLYKTMVLEEPVTYQAADQAILHFADLEASYSKMVDEANKVKALHRLPALQTELADAEARELLIRHFGADDDGPSSFLLWKLRTERGLLDDAVDENRRDHAAAGRTFAQAQADEAEYGARLERIARDKAANGGNALEERRRKIAALESSRERVYQANLKFQLKTEAINLVVPETAGQFAEAQSAAGDFLSGYEARERDLDEQEGHAREDLAPLTARIKDLTEEAASLKDRAGMVPMRLHNARLQMAAAAGLDPMRDLPFVAELIDVLPGEETWRKAIETTLGGLARTVLVDRNTRDRLSASIDGVTIRPRINYRAVTQAEHEDWRGDPTMISGKLAFLDSPFSRWVQDRVADSGVDHLCVTDAAGLAGPGSRVTRSGQTRSGDRGAHGESGEGNIIGFSNERRLKDIAELLNDLEPEIARANAALREIQERRGDLRRQREAHLFVQDSNWAAIDHLGIDREIAELQDAISRLRNTNEILDALETEDEQIRPLHGQANRDRVLAENDLDKLKKRWGDLVTRQDTVQAAVDEIVDQQTATVTDAQQEYLDGLFTSNWEATSLESFGPNITALRKRLREESETARRNAKSATSAMSTMFEAYKDKWTENNLGTTADSADGYREILDRIQSEGLYERRNKWRRELAVWSSDDLLRLNDAFDTALADIEDRLLPINRILETLPFGNKGGVLQISLRRLQNEDLGRFRRGLRELSSGLALELTEDQIEARFKKLSQFMARIRIPEGHTKSSTSQRDRYLDVRQHVVITAACLDKDTRREIATYDWLVDKSGGETQELVAFVVGSALRYQLGDETRSRPTFAPVFLDEGFVKADSEFAGRSVRAWQNLGFQLIIGAPLDKVTALEPHMDLLLTVTKNARGYSYISDLPDGPGVGGGA